MGWGIGFDSDRKRHIGYGVPSICDHPGCATEIDRGMAYRCGQYGTDDGCGLYFCGRHRSFGVISGEYCERCASYDPADESTWVEPFEPTADTAEWAMHVLTDASWAQWRREEPAWADSMKELI